MAHQVWIRPFAERDARTFAQYLFEGRAKNRFDPNTLMEKAGDKWVLRNTVDVYVAFDDTGIVGFIPVVNGNQVESLAFRPGLSPVTEAKALQAWQQIFIWESVKKGIPDAFFVTYDETVLEFAQRYGWGKVVVPMLNLHFADLEGKQDENHN